MPKKKKNINAQIAVIQWYSVTEKSVKCISDMPLKHHAQIFKELYEKNIDNYMKYHQDDQSIISSYVIDNDLVYWLDERFNKIWYWWREIFYPNFDSLPSNLKQMYIHNFISLNYFTHFTSHIDVEFI